MRKRWGTKKEYKERGSEKGETEVFVVRANVPSHRDTQRDDRRDPLRVGDIVLFC